MKQIEVQIMGQSYLLGCPDGGEPRLREAVERVDQAMCRIRDAGKVKARDRIAVLAALNLAFDLGSERGTLPATERDPASEAAQAPSAAAEDAAARTRLSQLVTRLDQVLASDGRLL
jgi:cell division protein ZapA